MPNKQPAEQPPHATLMTITPTMATEWVTKNRNKNRKVSDGTVLKYAEDIRQRRWRINGETIVMGKTGNILDGQHRLLAIIEAKMPIEAFVVSGVDDETFETLDSGRQRTPADVLGILGYPNVTELAALGRLDVIEQRYGSISESGRLVYPSTQEIVAMVNLHEDAYQEAINGTKALRRLFGQGSIFAFYWMRLGAINDSDRDFFFARLHDGLGLLEGDPIYSLRQAFLNAKTRNRQMSRQWLGGMMIKAWNKYRNHEKIKLLAFNATEPYPVPV